MKCSPPWDVSNFHRAMTADNIVKLIILDTFATPLFSVIGGSFELFEVAIVTVFYNI